MLEKLNTIIELHNNEPSVILSEGLLCISMAMNMAMIADKELLNKLENGG